MKRFLKDYRLHEHTEALFLLTLGIIIQVLDGSPFDVWDRWSLAWETEFPREFFSAFAQQIIKTVLSIIILMRCLTTVLYVLSGLVTVYCILRETSPKLMLPWLFISALKSVLLTFLETLTGVYVCSAFGKVRKPCIEFIISKAIELFFAIYLWACIRSIHKDLELFEEHCREEELLTKMVIHRVNVRSRRARSMIDESTLHRTATLNYFRLKDVPNIIFDMLKTEDELSQDSLLSPGMMLASVSNMGSYDYLKTSLSLGELGVIDLNSFQVAGLDDHRNLSPCARAMKFLRLTREDIRKARERTRSTNFADNYKVPENVLRNLIHANPSNFFNRVPRQNELFAAKLPDLDKVKEYLSKGKKSQSFREDILSESREFDALSQVEVKSSVERFIGSEVGDEEEDVASREIDDEAKSHMWSMTNVKDRVNRIGLLETQNTKRSDNYKRLYRQDHMCVIGPEVFDRASRLVKLTSLADVNSRGGMKDSESQLAFPCTSRGVEPPEERVEPPKPTKSKRIAFESDFGGPTTMPLSVIVTNFPVQLDSRISKCEVVYYRQTVTSSAEIVLLPDRGIEHRSEDGSYSEIEEKMSSLTTDPEDRSTSEDNIHRGSFAGDLSNSRKVNLFMLKCSRGTTPDFRYDLSGQPKLRALRRDEQELPILRSTRMIDDSLRDKSYIYPRISEQLMFIRDMMRRPIRDVLRSYYNLREANGVDLGVKRISSSHLRFEDDSTVRAISRFDAKESTPSRNQSAAVLSKKTFADRETQVSFAENGLRSTETVTLGRPRTNKLNTKENDLLPPLYLFGNTDLGWSSSPLEVNLGRTRDKPKCSRQVDGGECGTTRKGMIMSSRSFPEGSNTFKSNALTNDNVSCRMVLPPSQRNTLRDDSFSTAQDQISMEVIPILDDNPSICSADSDESFSLFYSKTADLASPLLDTRRFIYPDHIHYSYKNVKKKGFDVELNGGLPLLVRDSLTLNSSVNAKRVDTPPDPQTGITRRPMDLTFADIPRSEKQRSTERGELNHFEITELLSIQSRGLKGRSKAAKKERKWLKKFSGEGRAENPDDIEASSENLHSNKGRVGMLRNPAVILECGKQKKIQRSRLKNVTGCFGSFL